jgi:hypothetical protein
MPTLEELLKKHGINASETAPTSPRGKLLAQVDRMLKEIAKYKSNADLNGKSTKYWWAPQAVNGKRKISARYANKVVSGFTAYIDDDLASVKKALEKFKAVIEESDDATWSDEEARRKDSK